MQEELKRLGIHKILITNYFLECYAGSQLVTFDLAKILKNSGAHVTVAGFIIREPIISLFKSIDVAVINPLISPTDIKNESFDLIWGHHWPLIGHLVFEQCIKTKYLILSSLSAFEYIESIWMLTRQANIITFNCNENKATQENYLSYQDRSKSMVLLNSLTPEWFCNFPAPRNRGLKKIAIISNHIPKEVIEAMNLLIQKNIEVLPFGLQFKQTLITPDIIDGFDAIITIGHTVQKALARNIPVFCYDRFGGPGWITPENINTAENFNFSGRCCHKKMSGQAIFNSITNGFHSTLNVNLQDLCHKRYSLSENMKKIMRSLAPASSTMILNSSSVEKIECMDYLKERLKNLSVVGSEPYRNRQRSLRVINHIKDSTTHLFQLKNSDFSVSWLPNGSHSLKLSGFFLALNRINHLLRIYIIYSNKRIDAETGIHSPEIGKTFSETPFSYASGFSIKIPNFFRSREAEIYAELSNNEILHIATLTTSLE